ncbi:MAG: hypothetical protein LLG45_09255 [Actinomycetia bacterium]|nr:hypothetical protein [Actinomycetes bacterium]
MDRIELLTAEREKVLPMLDDALARHRSLLGHSIERTRARVNELAARLQVDPERLLAGQVSRTEHSEMVYLELEGELALLQHLRDQLSNLEQLTVCR